MTIVHTHKGLAGAGAGPIAADKDDEDENAAGIWSQAITQVVVRQERRLSLPPVEVDGLLSEPPLPGAAAESAESGDAAEPGDPSLPSRLTTELCDSRLGRLELTVIRTKSGLDIVIN